MPRLNRAGKYMHVLLVLNFASSGSWGIVAVPLTPKLSWRAYRELTPSASAPRRCHRRILTAATHSVSIQLLNIYRDTVFPTQPPNPDQAVISHMYIKTNTTLSWVNTQHDIATARYNSDYVSTWVVHILIIHWTFNILIIHVCFW